MSLPMKVGPINPMQAKLSSALDEVGAEALAGSGFEDEAPDLEFSEEAEEENTGQH